MSVRKWVPLLGSIFVIVGILVVACAAPSPASGPAAPANAATAVPAAATLAKPSGTLRIGFSSLANGAIDPQVKMNLDSARIYGEAIFDSLMAIGPDAKPAPGIAERWEMSPDGKTWTFYIRKGVKFHDGTDLTGEDVKFSLERIPQNSATLNSTAIRATLESVVIKDQWTVVVQLKNPEPEIWKFYSVLNGSEGEIVPKKYVEEKGLQYFTDHPIGSGPFKLVKYDFGTNMELEAVEGHWRAKPQFKTVKLMAIPEEATRVAMLATGDLDIAEISTDRVPEVKARPELRIVSYAGETATVYFYYYDVANPKSYPVGDARVRKALSLAINRQEMADTLFRGYAQVAAEYAIIPSSPYFDANVLKPDPYAPAEAKKLLSDAGFANGFDLKVFQVPFRPTQAPINDAIVGYWSKLGVRPQLVPMDWAVLRPNVQPKQQPLVWGNVIGYSVSPKLALGLMGSYHSKVGSHKNHSNAELDALIERAHAAVDMAERKKLALQAALAYKEEAAGVPLLFVDTLLGVNNKTVGAWKSIQGYYAPAAELERIGRAQ